MNLRPAAPRLLALIDLGFGDSGKGVFTDALCRDLGAAWVVRFNGGAQAGHNVVLADGRHHTFSQFGAGSFVPGVHSLLAAPVVVHPTALLVEAAVLAERGVTDALARLRIDGRCRITTPWHQAAGRLRERLRGAAAHGSCGVGVGETVGHGLAHPDEALTYADLARPAAALQRLHAQRRSLRASLPADDAGLRAASPDAAELLADEGVADRWLARVADLVRQVPPLSAHAATAVLRGPGRVVFEGAQGMLLDEWHGFHPHTTWSSVGPNGVRAMLSEAAVDDQVWHLGLLRSYMTRHGAGPMPTADPGLDALPEPHNADDSWQGRFRRGHPDAVLWRHALRATGRLDGLLVSHLDVLAGGRPALHWCDAYALPVGGTVQRITDLPAGPAQDLVHQERLTRLLQQAEPRLDPRPLAHADDLIERLESMAACRVRWTAAGPTAGHVRLRGPAAW